MVVSTSGPATGVATWKMMRSSRATPTRTEATRTAPTRLRATLCALAVFALGSLALGAAAHAGDSASATRPIPYVALAATPGAIPDTGAGDVEGELASAARANGLDPALVHAVAVQESGLRHEARSHRGAMGVMQLTPDTARDLGVDPRDLHQNIQGGAAYLRSLLVAFGGDVAKALAAYNAGPGAVLRYDGVPPFAETRNYVAQIMARVATDAVSVATTPLPTQAARAVLHVATGVKAVAQVAAQAASPQIAAISSAGVAAGSDPIGDAIATALRR